ncbi:hypothetical protein PS15m_010279 [Mucor circinelloides]
MLKCKTDLNIEELRDHIKRASDHKVFYELVEKVEESVSILNGSNGDAERLLEPRQDISEQTQAQTRYEQCQDLKGVRLFKDILLPHIESYAAMLKDVDDQITDQLFASNDIDRQKAIFDYEVLVRSDSAKFQKLTKFIENIKTSSSTSSTSLMEQVSTLDSTINGSRAYANPKRSSTLKRATDCKESLSSASSSSNALSVSLSQHYERPSSREKFTTDHRGKGKDRDNSITTDVIRPASQLTTATQSVNFTLQSVDSAKPVSHTLKRKVSITADPSPTPQRPTKVIKLTLEPPNRIAGHFYFTPSLSPSLSQASPLPSSALTSFSLASPTSPTSSATTSPYPAPLYNTVSATSPDKKRKHKEVDSSNENTKPSKESK